MFRSKQSQRVAHQFGWAGPIVLCLAVTACYENAFAPQDASIEVRVTGVPNDPGIRVTAFVQDLEVSGNRNEQAVAIGGSTVFSSLGADFQIRVGLQDLGAHNCTISGISDYIGSRVGDMVEIRTESGTTHSVIFELTCRSASLELHVDGLLAGDSARVVLASGDSLRAFSPSSPRDSIWVRNGTRRLARLPDSNVWIIPEQTTGSDGVSYEAPARNIALPSRQTTPASLQYRASTDQGAHIVIEVGGLPDDSALVFTAFVRDYGTGIRERSASLSMSGSIRFADVGSGRDVEVGIDGLDDYVCSIQRSSHTHVVTSGAATVRLTTRPGVTETFEFNLRCRPASLDLVVSGLLPRDSASLSLYRMFDSLLVRLPNGTRRVNVLPNAWEIIPANVTGSDGLTYRAATQFAYLPILQTTSVYIHYTTSACSYFGALASYPFNSSAQDATGNGHHGTVLGRPDLAPDRYGVNRLAFAFDGVDDWVELGDRFNNLTLPFSIAAWVYQPASVRNEFRSIFVSDDEPGRYAGFWLQLEPGGTPQITYGDGGAVGGTTRRTLSATNAIPADAWVHVAATVRGPTDMTLYVNGQPVPGTYSGTGGPLTHSSAPARIGNMTLVPANRPWLGMLDEVRLYDCSLPAQEVAALFLQR
jgi:hypothetical protein